MSIEEAALAYQLQFVCYEWGAQFRPGECEFLDKLAKACGYRDYFDAGFSKLLVRELYSLGAVAGDYKPPKTKRRKLTT